MRKDKYEVNVKETAHQAVIERSLSRRSPNAVSKSGIPQQIRLIVYGERYCIPRIKRPDPFKISKTRVLIRILPSLDFYNIRFDV